jgi:hypothetical protein
MQIIMLTNVRANGSKYQAGDEVVLPNQEAFGLIKDGHAKPITRQSRKTYLAMLQAHEARIPPAGPDIRDQFVSAPKVQDTLQVHMGRITLGNRSN